MKQLSVILAFLMGSISLSSCGDDEIFDTNNIPEKVKQELNSRYPGVVDVHWDVVKNYHVARFNDVKTRAAVNKYNTNVWFTKEGDYCQTDEDIAFNSLPFLVQEAFNRYKNRFYIDWDVDECEILARAGMASIFVIEIEKGDLEREISISEAGDILKDVLDDDEEDEILPILIPEEINAVLRSIFPNTYSTLSILEIEIDDDEIEIDVIENNRHKEIELDARYKVVSIEYEVSFKEAQLLMPEAVLFRLVELSRQAGIDLFDVNFQKKLEIEVKETDKGLSFELELEINDTEFNVEIDVEGNIKINN